MRKVVVIGNGMVGYKFCERLRKKASSTEIELVVFGEEFTPAYDRVHLSEYFENQSIDDLMMADRSWYEEKDISLRTGQLVTNIDTSDKTITTYQGHKENYDILVLATGSRPMVPPIEGTEKDGVFVYRTIEDLEGIIDYGKQIKSGAILGGGLLGLEAAKALLDMGLEAHVIEFASRLMPRQLDERGSEVLKNKIEALGIKVHLNKNTRQIEGNGSLTGLQFVEDQLKTDMLVISCGIVPRDELAKSCGLKTHERGGVIVNDLMETSEDSIYAIGEAACHNNTIYGLVAPGYEMADVVIDQLLGTQEKSFKGNDMSTKLKLIGVDVASFG
ncbi:MAG: FAD-dependent oxidoreductase, partial [Bacteroidota bacterium]